jgi:membrane protein
MVNEMRALLRDALRSYSRHGGRMLAAAVAFSALLSTAPLLFIALRVAAVATGDDRGRADVMSDLARWLGDDGARTLFGLLDRAAEHNAGSASVFGVVVLVYASTRLFSQLKRALNQMWDVQARSSSGFRGAVGKQARKRGLAVLMVLFVGAVIVAVVVAKAVLAAATAPLGDAGARLAWRVGEPLVSLGATTLLFGAIFKALPDAHIAWRDAWRGAFATAALFSVGATVIGLYLGRKALDAMYGPAGSVVMLLLWVHYSAQVFFFGAALTGELARRSGRPIEPDEHGMRVRVDEG